MAPASDRSGLVWALACACGATAVAIIFSIEIFGRIPHVQDSIAQLFQARIFAGGRLWAPAPPLPELFDYANVILKNDQWYSQYPPGHSLLLLPGVLLGIPWLVNPLLGGLTVLGVYLLGRELFGGMIARIAAFLGLLSPFLLLMSAEFMSHAGALFAITFFLYFYFRVLRGGRMQDGILAGIFCGLAILIRPFSAFGMILPCLLYAIWRLGRDRQQAMQRERQRAERQDLGRADRQLLRPMFAAAAVAALGGVLLLLYNWGTTGHPLRFGYVELHGAGHGLGFGKGPWGREPHTLARGLLFAWDRIQLLNGRLFEWPLTSLWPLLIALLVPLRGLSLARRWLLACFPLCLLAVHVFYWYHDANDCFGPRYVYEALAPLLLLCACGLIALGRLLSARVLGRRDEGGRSVLLIAVVIAAILSVVGGVTRWPALFRPPAVQADDSPHAAVRAGSPFEYYGRDYWGVSPDLGEWAAGWVAERRTDRAMVFVDTRVPPLPSEHMRLVTRHVRFGSAFAHQEPDLQTAQVVYAHLAPIDWKPRGVDPASELRTLMRTQAQPFGKRRVYYYREGMTAPAEIAPSDRSASGAAVPDAAPDAPPRHFLPVAGDTVRYRYGPRSRGSFALSGFTSPDTSVLPFRQELVFHAGEDSVVVLPAAAPTHVFFVTSTDTLLEVVIFRNERLEVLREYAAFDSASGDSIPPFTYASADDENLQELRRRYDLDNVAGDGGEIERIINLMRWVHDVARHDGESTNPSPRNALHLIEVCQVEDRGVNCRMIATILNEVYLAMGYPSRHLTCQPFDKEDPDCHVITIVYSRSRGEWLYMDPTFETYWMDAEGTVLGPHEVRAMLVAGEIPRVSPGLNWNGMPHDPDYYRLYVTKNLFRFFCPLVSEFGYESREGPRSWVTLNPLGYDEEKVAERDSTGTYIVDYYTHDAELFWAPPRW